MSPPSAPPTDEPQPWRTWLGVVLVALSAAAFAIAFRWALTHALVWTTGKSDVVAAMRAAPIWARVLCPAVGGLLAGLLGRLVVNAPSSGGVGDVMEAVVLGRVNLRMGVTLIKSFACWLAIVFGGSLGREGPLIQFGGAAGKLVSDRLRVPNAARLLIAAGTAAGFAAAYDTPFAAVLFVLEVVTGVVVLDAILPALVATVIATTTLRALVGDGPIYGQRAFGSHAPLELVAFAGLGLCATLVAQGFMSMLHLGDRVFKHRALPLPWRSALGGAIDGGIVALLPEVAGNGAESLNALLDGKFAIGFVALLLVGKALATTASVSSGSPGGVFTPTLLLGGATGLLFANALTALGCHVSAPGGYALVGMAAVTAATTHAPLMAAVMVFELSGDYSVALPLILATAIATIVSRRLRKDSLYAAELRSRGVGWDITFEGVQPRS